MVNIYHIFKFLSFQNPTSNINILLKLFFLIKNILKYILIYKIFIKNLKILIILNI